MAGMDIFVGGVRNEGNLAWYLYSDFIWFVLFWAKFYFFLTVNFTCTE